jgi:light-regulated signal transduction histidine kinase (bacteriophytochrome)
MPSEPGEERELHLRTLENYDREISDLFHALAHDLRAPLRTIDGFSQAVADDYADVLGENGASDLTRVRNAAANMEAMITGLMALARVTRAPLRRIDVNASELAASIAARLKEGEAGRDVEFVIEPDVVVNADSQLLSIALEQLFANAWKFTSTHEKATIAFGQRSAAERVELFVRDDGAGFDPAHSGKLFVPFQRLHSQKEFPGDGIGLAVVRRIAHRHLGSVAAEGSVEKGATIYFGLG